ncbi:MAG: AAA family ATPase [Proteobacteria bacterium]|nr:AAA family ATPase [Pseudomonadota bacterium]
MSEIGECIAFANYKGGTGKTTSCLSIAGFLAKGGSKVLLIDFDPQASATSGIGIDKLTLKHTIYDSILGLCDGHEDVPLKNIILETDVKNLHLAPSEWDLSAAEVSIQSTKEKITLLRTLIRDVQSLYDYILIDTPPSSGLLLMNCFVAADHMIIPFDPGIFSVEAIDNLKTVFLDVKRNTGHHFNKITIILTRYVGQDPLERILHGDNPSRQIKKMLVRMFKSVFVVPESPEIFKSQQKGTPISHYAPKSKAGKAYKKIADSIKKSNLTL